MDSNNSTGEIQVWEKSPPGEAPRLKGTFTAISFDDAVQQLLRSNPALNDLYRKEDGKHFLYQFQLFPTEKEATA